MAWTNIDNALVSVGALPFATTIQALRDNPIAIANGDAGAPRVQAAALDTGTEERDWVLARNAGAESGVVGSYIAAWNETTTAVNRNSTIAGSSLRVLNGSGSTNTPFDPISSGSTSFPTTGTTTLSGTWRAMTYCPGRIGDVESGYQWTPTLWLRIS